MVKHQRTNYTRQQKGLMAPGIHSWNATSGVCGGLGRRLETVLKSGLALIL